MLDIWVFQDGDFQEKTELGHGGLSWKLIVVVVVVGVLVVVCGGG